MKKVLILLICILFMGGCSSEKNKTPPMPELNFKGDISVTYNNYNLECSIYNNLAKGCTITVKEPGLLSGLKMIVKGGNCKLEMGRVSYEFDPAALKQTEFATSLSDALVSVLNTTKYSQLDDGSWKYTGQTEIGQFILIQDGETGYPISLEIPEADLSVNFKNMKSDVDK